MSENVEGDGRGLPQGWARTAIGETGEYINGLAFRPEDWGTEGKPIIRIQNLNTPDKAFNYTTRQVTDSYLVRRGDILVSWSASLDAYVWHGVEAVLNQHIFKVVPDEQLVDRSFLFYLLKNQIQILLKSEHLHGSTMKHINRGPFLATKITLPPLPEQARIVARIEELLSQIDAGAAGLRDVQKKIKRYRASVLKAACEGTLVPTEAALAAQENRAFEPAGDLLARILTERRARWEADQLEKMRAAGKEPKDDKWKMRYEEPVAPNMSELPELPAGWTWATVQQLSRSVRYGSSAKTDDNPAGIPVLRMGNIQNGTLDWASLKYLPQNHAEFPDLLLHNGDLLFNRTNSAELVGKSAVYKGSPAPASFASYLIGVRLHENCRVDYLNFFINSAFGKDWVASVVTQQVGQANVNGTKLQALTVPLPPLAEQERIVAEVERRLSVVDQMEAAIAVNLKRADRLRQAVLRDAFAGKLVPQDPTDEPAGVLLERIRAARDEAAATQARPTRKKEAAPRPARRERTNETIKLSL